MALKATWTTPYSIDGSPLDVAINNLAGAKFDETITGTTPLTFTSATPKVCVVGSVQYVGTSTSHTRASIKAIWNGTCQITVSFAGNTTLSPTQLSTAFTISGMTTPQPGAGASQIINFYPLSIATFGSQVPLTAQSTSKLPVTFRSSPPAICSISQDSAGAYFVTPVSGLSGDANNCSVTASQAGDERWAAIDRKSTRLNSSHP